MKIDDFQRMVKHGVGELMVVPALKARVELDDGTAHCLIWYEEDQGRENVTLFDLQIQRCERDDKDDV